MKKQFVSARINIPKLEGFGEIRSKARIHTGEKLAEILKGDLQ